MCRQTVKASRFPTWKDTFEFDVPYDTTPESKITFEVWDWDRVGADDFMGQVITSSISNKKAQLMISQYINLNKLMSSNQMNTRNNRSTNNK